MAKKQPSFRQQYPCETIINHTPEKEGRQGLEEESEHDRDTSDGTGKHISTGWRIALTEATHDREATIQY